MKVELIGHINDGIGPSAPVTLERGRDKWNVRLTISSEYEYRNIEIDGIDLWRAVAALLADPDKHGLYKDVLDA